MLHRSLLFTQQDSLACTWSCICTHNGQKHIRHTPSRKALLCRHFRFVTFRHETENHSISQPAVMKIATNKTKYDGCIRDARLAEEHDIAKLHAYDQECREKVTCCLCCCVQGQR